MDSLFAYAEAFREGLNYFLYCSDITTREKPILDESNLESIGYYDGFNYGEYLEMTRQTMSISQEQLMAVIDKNHTQALKKHFEYMKMIEKGSYKVK